MASLPGNLFHIQFIPWKWTCTELVALFDTCLRVPARGFYQCSPLFPNPPADKNDNYQRDSYHEVQPNPLRNRKVLRGTSGEESYAENTLIEISKAQKEVLVSHVLRRKSPEEMAMLAPIAQSKTYYRLLLISLFECILPVHTIVLLSGGAV